jgi:UDP-glucose 4-epimerase
VKLLVTGGAGYIGSVVSRHLREAGHGVIILDDLSNGHRPAASGAELTVADFGDREVVRGLLERGQIEGVVHMAASALVSESVRHPSSYYQNNLQRSLVLLDVMREVGVRRLVLSSTAAVYGEPITTPMAEDHPTRPTNPYGETKLALERALHWHREAYGLAYVSLRYFNAAGATSDGALGEVHSPETHLIPNVLRAAVEGTAVPVYGTDYGTPDGTAVRDYIHVEDLAEAHLLAFALIQSQTTGAIFNLGNGEGYSVMEVIDAARRVTGRRIEVHEAPRRAGDPERLVASSGNARKELKWCPRHPRIETMIESSWRFLRGHPKGYPC